MTPSQEVTLSLVLVLAVLIVVRETVDRGLLDALFAPHPIQIKAPQVKVGTPFGDVVIGE